MDFRKSAMGMLAAAIAATPVVVAQGNGAHGSVHGSTSTATHSGPLFTGILCGAMGDSGDQANLFSEFINQHGHEYWVGGSDGDTTDGNQPIGWRMQTNNIHPTTWSVQMNIWTATDSDGPSGVDESAFSWFLQGSNGFVGEYIPLDTISNSEPTCVTARSLSNGFVQYNYNSRFDPGVSSSTKYASGIYFYDFGPGDETSWEDFATAPVIAGHGAVPDVHNTPSVDCNGTNTDSFVGS